MFESRGTRQQHRVRTNPRGLSTAHHKFTGFFKTGWRVSMRS